MKTNRIQYFSDKSFFRLLTIVFIILTATNCRLSQFNKTSFDEEKQKEFLLGRINMHGITGELFGNYYFSEYNSYVIDDEIVSQLIEKRIQDYNFVLIMASWCKDSKREVPRILKVLNGCGIKSRNVKIIAVDFKKAAIGTEVEELNIKRVPTLIVFRDKTETGRIIETPENTIESDLLRIIE